MKFHRAKILNQSSVTPKFKSQKDPKASPFYNPQQFHFSIDKYSAKLDDETLNTIVFKPKMQNIKKLSQLRRKQSRSSSKNQRRSFQADNIFQEKYSYKPTTSRGIKNASYLAKQQFDTRNRYGQEIFIQRRNKDYQQLNLHPNAKSFAQLMAIGKGGFGRVWKVVEIRSRRIFAMKVMRKSTILKRQSILSVMNERLLLAQLRHPFLVNMRYAFQDNDNLYLIMDYCNRGDLRYHLIQNGRFQEHQMRFFLSCIILCIQYLHFMNIIHRDLKPQNLVLDDIGYVKIMDLGISRQSAPENSKDTSGTPGYMAPEILFRRNHSFFVDYYALGVIGFEFMTGKRPYIGVDRQELRQKVMARQVQLTSVPQGWSKDSVNLINSLIQRNPQDRLGFNGIDQIKSHPFFKSVDWNLLHQRKIVSPFIPKTIEEDFQSYQHGIPDATSIQNGSQNYLGCELDQSNTAFKGYEYDGNWGILQKISFVHASQSRNIRSLIK